MVFIVAEIGVNWDGDFGLVKEMMSMAKKAGFDAVKFQAFNKSLIQEHPEWERLMNSTISQENIEKINSIAQDVGIEWFCTPMYKEAVDLLEPFVKRFKIRVADGRSILKNKPSELAQKVLNSGKDVIISVERTPKDCIEFKNPKIRWLYCVAKYPCTFLDLDFSNFNQYDGYSNHCPDILAPITAVILRADIIEVHVTSDKSKSFMDNPVSFDYSEQLELCKQIRNCEKIKR